jgi:hypothetical protein
MDVLFSLGVPSSEGPGLMVSLAETLAATKHRPLGWGESPREFPLAASYGAACPLAGRNVPDDPVGSSEEKWVCMRRDGWWVSAVWGKFPIIPTDNNHKYKI